MPTLINTVGSADANSYVADVAEAGALIGQELVARTAWDAADATDKERALITAARGINAGILWKGERKTTTQAMEWPRVSYEGRGYVKYGYVDGYDFPETWPVNVPRMQALYAVALLERRAAGQVSGGVDSTASIRRMKAGSVEIEYREASSFIAGYTFPDDLLAMAAPWGTRRDLVSVNVEMVR